MVYFHHPDEFCPVSESAYCGAGSLHTMLLHTTTAADDPTVQIFPGLPPSWADATFHNLRASGGLSVSAVRKGGHTLWVYFEAMGETSVVVTFEVADDPKWFSVAPQVIPASGGPSVSTGARAGVWEVALSKGEAVVMYPAGVSTVPDLTIEPLAGNPAEFNYWGYNRDMHPLH
jgi:hypothetical protein